MGSGNGASGPARGRGLPFGVNVVGYFKGELGVGQVGRLLLSTLEQTGIPYTASAFSAFFSREDHPFEPVGEPFAYDTNLLCVNADQLPGLVGKFGSDVLKDRYNIGVWWWEVELLPEEMAGAADLLDEIWVGSEHVGRAVVAATHKLVRLLPMPIVPVDAPAVDRRSLDLPDGFMFLFTFDFLSVFERKNPIAVVEAFKRAFSPGEGPFLLIKSINGEDHSEQLQKLRMAAGDRPDIRIMDGYLAKKDQDGLLAACDCYVSLHRAEGYGLGLAEAASLGKPIIATGYSGNLTFLNRGNSHLVGYRLVNVPSQAGPYPQQALWADPDIEEAAEKMRTVYLHPEQAGAMGEKARQEVGEIHTLARAASFIRNRLEVIRLQTARRKLLENA